MHFFQRNPLIRNLALEHQKNQKIREAPQGLWGTRELAIFINGDTGTSGNFQGTTFKKGLLLRNWETFQHSFLGNIQQILLGTREIF